MYNDENIKKLVEDAIKNMDTNGEFFKNIVSQITEQIKNEQSKIEQEKISEPKISKKLGDKANTYLNNNKSLDSYISNRDKFMGVFDKITKDKITEKINQYEKDLEELEKNYNEAISSDNEDCPNHYKEDYCKECEFAEECNEDTDNTSSELSNNISYTSYMSGWKQTTNKDGNPIGYLYFNFNSNSDHPDTYKQILDYYSILSLHADEWDNWVHGSKDYNKEKFHLSILIDNYTYLLECDETQRIDEGEDDITSFIYTKPDDDLKMFSIYILNYSRETNKLYDFIRLIITLPDEITESDAENYYINLEKYFSDKERVNNLIEDYMYTFINKFKVNHHLPVKEEEDMYVLLQGDIIHQIIGKIDSEPTKIEFKKEDTTDKTNSILDELGIPHDNEGNVEIPITPIDSTPSFISQRRFDAEKIFDFLKDNFDYDEEDDKTNKSYPGCYVINTGNSSHDDFLSKAIKDGYIKVEVISDTHVHLNINGTLVFMNNPYENK